MAAKRLPFRDSSLRCICYRVEKWDYDAPNTQDESKRQWEKLVWGYHSLTLAERWPSYKSVCSQEFPSPASEEVTTRILASNQTTRERKATRSFCSGEKLPLWLRTCYDPAIAAQYECLEYTSHAAGPFEDRLLNDEKLYSFDNGSENSWRHVLVRVPGLTDLVGGEDAEGDGSDFQYFSGQGDDIGMAEGEELDDNEAFKKLASASDQVQAVICLLDREAITAGHIKVLWLNEHGECIWDNWATPQCLKEFIFALGDANRLDELSTPIRGTEITR